MEMIFLFKIGSKVFYPMHGLGIIRSIEEKEVDGEKKSYYIIDLFSSTMNIMIPTDKITKSNLRMVNDLSTLEKIFTTLEDDNSYEALSQKERYSMNMKRMKSGSLKDGIELVRDLTHLDNIKKLNNNEMQILTTIRKFIIDEISSIKNITEKEADNLLNSKIS